MENFVGYWIQYILENTQQSCKSNLGTFYQAFHLVNQRLSKGQWTSWVLTITQVIIPLINQTLQSLQVNLCIEIQRLTQ